MRALSFLGVPAAVREGCNPKPSRAIAAGVSSLSQCSEMLLAGLGARGRGWPRLARAVSHNTSCVKEQGALKLSNWAIVKKEVSEHEMVQKKIDKARRDQELKESQKADMA